MKDSRSLTRQILPLFLILILLATVLAAACSAPRESSYSANDATPSTPYTPPTPSPQPAPVPVNLATPAADCLAKRGPALITEDKALFGCDPVTGRAQEVKLCWEQLCGASAYDIEIAKKADFTYKVVDWAIEDTCDPDDLFTPADVTAPCVVFPTGGEPISAGSAIALAGPLECGHTYYWRVQARSCTTIQVISSPWSEVRSFTVKAGLPVVSPYLGIQPIGPGKPVTPSGTPPSAPPVSGATAPSVNLPWSKSSDTIGLAVGGSKDINNFRENIKNGFLPLPTDMTCEGLYYDYYFDTGQTKSCNKLYCPSYSYAVTRDPFSSKTDYYLSVGLNSGMKQSDFERKKLNLVIVLDISGSMSDTFNSYYYDQFGNQAELDWNDRNTKKIEVAKDAVISILKQLNDDDRFGIVLYNSQAYLLQGMTTVRRADMGEVYDRISEINAESNTNLSAGMQLGTDLVEKYGDYDPFDYENRIIFLTDAMPNTGETGAYSLLRLLKDNADNHIYTTFIGIGVDFNTELIETITKTRGANYYSVHSPREFRERVEQEFDYMVTPLVFNLRLALESDDWEIEQVYGSPEADKATGELMKVNTLFPSKRVDGETKGGLILLKLKNIGDEGGSIRLKTSYEDRDGNVDGSEAKIYFDKERPEYFDNSGIRKGVLLSRYADLTQNWLIDEREHASWSRPWEPRVNTEDGIIVPPTGLGQWERTSLPLMVSSQYRSLFRDFSGYFSDEISEIGDNTLLQELQLLRQLGGVISYGGYED